ncbi:MAG: preprotein translocase subunit YajC [Alphaproteobacteria bacterium]|nr:preprotein translocase subunit YajC [Alphaproteobacteria bacterium]
MNFIPLLLIFAVFYVLLIRPQQKKIEQHNVMLKTLRRGDRVITGGGIVGTVNKLEGDDYLIVEIADNIRVKVLRSTITSLSAKTEPAAVNDDAADKKN